MLTLDRSLVSRVRENRLHGLIGGLNLFLRRLLLGRK